MGFLSNLFGPPPIPPIDASLQLVDWFFRYDPKKSPEINLDADTYGVYGNWKIELSGILTQIKNQEECKGYLSMLMGIQEELYKGLYKSEQLEYAMTFEGAKMKVNLLKIEIFMRVVGYVLLKKYGVEPSVIEPMRRNEKEPPEINDPNLVHWFKENGEQYGNPLLEESPHLYGKWPGITDENVKYIELVISRCKTLDDFRYEYERIKIECTNALVEIRTVEATGSDISSLLNQYANALLGVWVMLYIIDAIENEKTSTAI